MRKSGWQKSLWALLEECRDKPFVWGSHDCATLACRVIKIVTGVEPTLQVYWKDEADAMTVIEQAGGLQLLVENHLGAAVNWGQCGAGDIVLTLMPNGEALAVHDGAQLIAPSPNGLRRIPFQFAVCGWRI